MARSLSLKGRLEGLYDEYSYNGYFEYSEKPGKVRKLFDIAEGRGRSYKDRIMMINAEIERANFNDYEKECVGRMIDNIYEHVHKTAGKNVQIRRGKKIRVGTSKQVKNIVNVVGNIRNSRHLLGDYKRGNEEYHVTKHEEWLGKKAAWKRKCEEENLGILFSEYATEEAMLERLGYDPRERAKERAAKKAKDEASFNLGAKIVGIGGYVGGVTGLVLIAAMNLNAIGHWFKDVGENFFYNRVEAAGPTRVTIPTTAKTETRKPVVGLPSYLDSTEDEESNEATHGLVGLVDQNFGNPEDQ